MTDKPIMIDGVDVSGCKYWKGYCRIASLCDYPGHLCEITHNCYYKQLKRKEEECQQAMDNYVQLDLQRVKEYNELVDLYKAKEQECEELKKKLQADNCLTEIKEIYENNDELQGDFNVVDCDKCKLGKHNLANKILQKISECEVEK